MSGYWRSLWSSLDFADQLLKNCVNIIHDDIVEIWNLNDKAGVRFPQLLTFKPEAQKDNIVPRPPFNPRPKRPPLPTPSSPLLCTS